MVIKKIDQEIQDHIDLVLMLKTELSDVIEISAKHIINAFENQKKILLFGNGGSAGDAQHIAAEFTGRFVKERIGLPAIALTTDTSAITAIGNDYGFEFIFSRQIEALANNGDILIGISTSGNSANVLNAIQLGKTMGCYTISLTGKDGGALKKVSDLNINIAHQVTARIQEMHILIGHLICSYIDQLY